MGCGQDLVQKTLDLKSKNFNFTFDFTNLCKFCIWLIREELITSYAIDFALPVKSLNILNSIGNSQNNV